MSAKMARTDMLEMVTELNCGEAPVKEICCPKRMVVLESCVAEVLLLKARFPHWPGAPCAGLPQSLPPFRGSSAREVMTMGLAGVPCDTRVPFTVKLVPGLILMITPAPRVK